MPIGNLTSQVFANIYLHEFDRFVRHQLKPQAYLRYGDDFIVFGQTRRLAGQYRLAATDFLADGLRLRVNPRNDVVVATGRGLKFLGHDISSTRATTDLHTVRQILQKVNGRNIASYRALPLPTEVGCQLDWFLLGRCPPDGDEEAIV